jgi:hypothetical protein
MRPVLIFTNSHWFQGSSPFSITDIVPRNLKSFGEWVARRSVSMWIVWTGAFQGSSQSVARINISRGKWHCFDFLRGIKSVAAVKWYSFRLR